MGLDFGNGLANNIAGSDDADQIYGYGNNDTQNGGLGNDQLVGSTGRDILVGGEGDDFLCGGSGNDTADYSATVLGVHVFLDHRFGDGRGFGGDAQRNHLVGIEIVSGLAIL